jgi:hypothetical protein
LWFGVAHQTFIILFRSWPRGPSSFPVAEKNQNATAAPDAMKGSGLANEVRAAPAKAEERLSTVSASVSDNNNWITLYNGIFD